MSPVDDALPVALAERLADTAKPKRDAVVEALQRFGDGSPGPAAPGRSPPQRTRPVRHCGLIQINPAGGAGI